MTFGPATPIFRIFDEAKAREFYSLRLAWTPIVARRVFPVHETYRLFGVDSPADID